MKDTQGKFLLSGGRERERWRGGGQLQVEPPSKKGLTARQRVGIEAYREGVGRLPSTWARQLLIVHILEGGGVRKGI